jgi:hypothetical protein
MKLVKITSTLLTVLFISACSTSITTGELKDSYSPVAINNADVNNSATIKVADGIIIWKVDGERQVNFLKVMFGNGFDSIIVTEGKHSFSGSFKGKDINVGQVYYKSGNEYLLDYVVKGDRIHYWIKDLTTNEVVYGKEFLVD